MLLLPNTWGDYHDPCAENPYQQTLWNEGFERLERCSVECICYIFVILCFTDLSRFEDLAET